jgi:glycosidase
MKEFGGMADFDTLLAGIKQRHMRLIIDLVVNHTSDEHKWFVESRKSKDNPYRDFYIWQPGHTAPDGTRTAPNNYPSYVSVTSIEELIASWSWTVYSWRSASSTGRKVIRPALYCV